jgi:hypothetical protein
MRENLPEVPSTEGEDVRFGFELQSGLPWSGDTYQPAFSSMSLTVDVPPEVLIGIAAALLLAVVPDVCIFEVAEALIAGAGAETSTERDPVSWRPSD